MLYRQHLEMVRDQFNSYIKTIEELEECGEERYMSFLERYISYYNIPCRHMTRKTMEKSIDRWIRNCEKDLDGYLVDALNAYRYFVRLAYKKIC